MKLGYGAGSVNLEVEGDERFELVLPNELSGAEDEAAEIEKSLDDPIGPALQDFDGRKRAAIMASDVTRPAPTSKMLPPLVKRLEEIGVSEILVVFGLGTHRRMTSEEEKRLLGGSADLPHIQHDKDRCVGLGETSRGTPVEILEEVAASDLKIGTGNIEYHYYAGYSGGAKAILPGVSSENSVNKNHAMMVDPRSKSGRLDGPVRLDMEEAAKIAGLDFILNVVLNSRKEIVRAVAGDHVKAHRVGAKVVDEMYRKVVKPAEIVVTCAGGRPKDINLFQAQKAMENAKEAVLPGGSLILLAECAEGLGHPVFERWAREAKCAEDCVERFGREYEFGGHKAALIARESLEKDLILVSSMRPELAEMCFFRHAKSLEEALAMARKRQGQDARTIVMPHGNLTLATRR
ncbi:MAG TPA: nickel-dependent lactate racemase [Methanothrix sp.]|nr:nickel-dependent lactate racemase [Methanothrix sp.]HPJ84590.1 nickel-dependent lactate racemase [Methanothrix sp.]HPR66300.1 nickel-dependent lactate racemase [Methanothrix sp.]